MLLHKSRLDTNTIQLPTKLLTKKKAVKHTCDFKEADSKVHSREFCPLVSLYTVLLNRHKAA